MITYTHARHDSSQEARVPSRSVDKSYQFEHESDDEMDTSSVTSQRLLDVTSHNHWGESHLHVHAWRVDHAPHMK